MSAGNVNDFVWIFDVFKIQNNCAIKNINSQTHTNMNRKQMKWTKKKHDNEHTHMHTNTQCESNWMKTTQIISKY